MICFSAQLRLLLSLYDRSSQPPMKKAKPSSKPEPQKEELVVVEVEPEAEQEVQEKTKTTKNAEPGQVHPVMSLC